MNQKIKDLLNEMNTHKNTYYDNLPLTERLTADHIKQMRDRAEYTATSGKKYTKIINRDGVIAFIDADLNVYKPASWAAPAKHMRGNLNVNVRDGFTFDGLGLVFVKYIR